MLKLCKKSMKRLKWLKVIHCSCLLLFQLLEEKGEELKGLQKKYDKTKEQFSTARKDAVDLQSKYDDVEQVLRENRAQSERWSAELAKLREKLKRHATDLAFLTGE